MPRLDEVLHTMIEQQHSRLPVYEGAPEKIIGILHYKDLLPVWEERRVAIRSGRPSRAFRIGRLLRRPLVVPETKPLSQMLDEFRKGRSHMAMVVDEFGTIIGMLTVEDVLEQMVGRIEDEHDDKDRRRQAEEAGTVELDGATRIRELESEYGIEIPADAGFETLAGFLLFRLGEIPHAGAVRGLRRAALHRAGDGAQPHRARANRKASGAASGESRLELVSRMLGIDSKAARYVWTAAVVVLLLYLVYLVRWTLFIFILAVLLAYLISPLVNLLDRHLPASRTRTPALALAYMISSAQSCSSEFRSARE